MIIHIRPDPDAITVDDVIRLESGDTSMRFLVDLLARLAHDEYGVPIPKEDATKYLRGLTLTEIREQIGALTRVITDTDVPKASVSP